ncbi:integrase core domain protein [Oesophagostomum dentatum]|uniref:RNA-directed DNA polymerase n=1 Tax=Oesophagostomum dentatum TaxID=61180 RepID=A0A0B1TTI0_OESDE|nr:integrase core domain protein [Oesophagostomum dentatum]
MNDFKRYIRARVFIYIDDLITTSATPQEHLSDIDEVLGKIESIGMKLKANKYHINTITAFRPSDLQRQTARDEQDQCDWIARYKELLRNEDNHPKLYNYVLINDILYRLPTRLHQDPQIVLPEDSLLKDHLTSLVHQSQTGAAHLGLQKTHAAVQKIATWNNMGKHIATYVQQCQFCQSRKDPSAYRLREPLHQFEIPTKPWQRVHTDVIGPLPLTLLSNKYIVVFVDAVSKFIVAEPIADQKAATTAQTFVNRFVARFGLPETLVTDQGSNYMSDAFRSLLRNLNVHHRTSTPYHHESNGQVERALCKSKLRLRQNSIRMNGTVFFTS